MKRFITSETNPIIVKKVGYIDVRNNEELQKNAEIISKETGVPFGQVYAYKYINQWIKIENEWYYCKVKHDFYLANELLGEVISQYFGLDTVHYQIIRLLGNNCEIYTIMSKNICDPNAIFKKPSDFRDFQYYNELEVLDNLHSLCKSESEHQLLLSDIKKLFIRDFYVSQNDRNEYNFMFRIDEDGIRLAPLFDYERSFNPTAPKEYFNSYGSTTLKKYYNFMGSIDMDNEKTICRLRDDEEFQRLLYLIMDAKMELLIQCVEDNHRIIIPSDYKEIYLNHDKEMKKIIRESNVLQ